jgi:trimeric autotransporter adhesin
MSGVRLLSMVVLGAMAGVYPALASAQSTVTSSLDARSASGSCAAGDVACAAPTIDGDITAVTVSDGLQGGGQSGDVSVGLRKTLSGAFDFRNVNGFVAAGSPLGGPIPAQGVGVRLMWYPGKRAFRAGQVLTQPFLATDTSWDDSNTGFWSTGMGLNAMASGNGSFAVGEFTAATSETSIAMGNEAVSTGFSSVAIGRDVYAEGDGSIVLGSHAQATPNAPGTFMFGDGTSNAKRSEFFSFQPNQFLVRASGGVVFYTSPDYSTFVQLSPRANAWSSSSDVNLKQNFRELDGSEVLAKIAKMPIREWSYKAQEASIRHVGPTAQDFYAAFGLGEEPLRISTIDADGVALRAVQALEARTRAENETLKAEIAALREELAAAIKNLRP